MVESRILNDVKTRLDRLNIYELRQVARAVGVHRPADGKKSRVTEAILSIATGETAPEPPASRGAPPKSQQFDEQLVADIKTCREYYLALSADAALREPRVLTVSDSVAERLAKSMKRYCGILDVSGQYAFMRVDENGYNGGEVFVHESFISRFKLRYGDFIECNAMRKSEDEIPGLVELISVNGIKREQLEERPDFSRLTPIYPAVSIKTEHAGGDIACRMVDMLAPIALGQRAFISAPARSGKTTLIKQLAQGICANYPYIKVIVVALNERPEEITDLKRTLEDCELFYTGFAMPAENHIRTARLAVEYAKRYTEAGESAIIFFDGITRLMPFCQSEAAAREEISKLLYSACNAEEGGSLTIISTLSQEDNVGAPFIGLANMVISLSAELAAKRVFPAIDISKSFADGEERLLDTYTLKAARRLRSMPVQEVIGLFNESLDNYEIIKKLKD